MPVETKPEVIFALEGAAWPALLVAGNGAILMSNPAARETFAGSLEGEPPQLASIWAPENGNSAGVFLEQWEAKPTPVLPLKFRGPTGPEHTYTTSIAKLENNGNKWFVIQLLNPVKGTPALHPAESSGEFHDVALKQKLDCVLQLARSLSLDFNNALTGVLAHTSLLLGKAATDHPWRRSLLEVEKSAARAAEIASELALFSRQEKETRRAPAGNVNTVIGRSVDFFRNTYGARLQWQIHPDDTLFEARFDEAKVQQALTRVIENAAESFAENQPGKITVETRNVILTEPTQDRNVRLAAGTYVCVEVTDTGKGIDAESLPRVFEPFFTTKRPPHRGLGLALVYGIITNHGGGIAISSEQGKGTSARVYLPAEKSRVRNLTGTDHGLQGNGVILVVDDESLLLTMAETILTDFGYQVITANGGQAALEILAKREDPIDLIITDLVMPGMGGRELVEHLQVLNPGLPIICTSGYVMPEDQQSTAGYAYLRKPFTCSELLEKVKTAFIDRNLERNSN